MTIRVLAGGVLTTVQDLGRTGSQKSGVIVSGAMDPYSSRIANLLVGNDQGEAGLEMTLAGPTLQFEEDTVIALTGADLQPKLDGEPIGLWRPISVTKGAVLTCRYAIAGCRTYLAAAGGIDVPVVMSSKSTYLAAGIGGFEGRALWKGDSISTGPLSDANKAIANHLQKNGGRAAWFIPPFPFVNQQKTPTIRFLRGTEYDAFQEESRQAFITESYLISPQSNRMGARLEGSPLQLNEKLELLSSGVTYGTIQIPPDGQPIILMADRQTTGGYPKIGHVITADLATLAQCKPGNKIRFKEVTLEQAEAELMRKEQLIEQIQLGLRTK